MSKFMDRLKKHRPHILVVGDLMLDHYLWGKCERISPEAPVQVVDIRKETTVLGGAGNVIYNLHALGAHVSVASVIGDDDIANEMVEQLDKSSVDSTLLLRASERKTTKKSRVIASNQQIVRIDKEDKDDIDDAQADTIVSQLAEKIATYDLVILSDYGKGVLTPFLTQSLITLANKHGKKVLVDPKGTDYSKYSGAYLLTPNRKEAETASGKKISNDTILKEVGFWLKEQFKLTKSMITLSEDGIAIFDQELQKIPTVAKEVFDVTGAGDTVIASLGFSLTAGYGLDEAAKFANSAAAVVVAKIGSATATLEEIEAYESTIHKSSSDSHIKTADEIEVIVKRAKEEGKKIVFTNGCFDILHVGHVKYLEAAKQQGDMLVLGLNSDDSVTRLKGPERPVNIWEDRAYILAALEAVDYVVGFEDDTPYELIKRVEPDVLVKGGDYKGKEVVGSDIAKSLCLIDFVDGKSTTNTIKRIRGEVC
jgi:D-beta-D-heptose 7-phosphate kinase/D-beta-D-heptose 1-phosphate adenosyltransferase